MRPSADVLLESLAARFGGLLLAVVLTAVGVLTAVVLEHEAAGDLAQALVVHAARHLGPPVVDGPPGAAASQVAEQVQVEGPKGKLNWQLPARTSAMAGRTRLP